MIELDITPEGTASARPTEFLGPQRFTVYRALLAACGATYNASTKTNRLDLASLQLLMSELEAQRFPFAVTDRLRAALIEQATTAASVVEEGESRLKAAEAALPEGVRFFPYQRQGIRWLAARRGALLGDEMGLGKTLQAIIAAPPSAGVLVIAPAAVSVAWAVEAKKWRRDLRPFAIQGSARFRWPEPGELGIATYGSMPGTVTNEPGKRRRVEEELPVPGHEIVLVADEAHMLKNPKAQRTVKFRALRDLVFSAGGRVWLLTGTPLLNRTAELWAVLEAAKLGCDAFGSWPAFCALVNEQRVAKQAPAQLQRVALIRRKADVLPDLPAKSRNVWPVPLDAESVRLCDELVAKLAAAGLGIESLIEGTAGGVGFELISRVRSVLASSKLAAALERVEAYEEEELPLVVFCAHTEPLRKIAERPGWALIDGTVSPEERGKIVQRFQAGELRGVACSYAAAGVGITLTRSSNMLHIDLPWTPALLQQAEDRICRIGQRSACTYEQLVGQHALEERVAQLLSAKLRLIEAAVMAAAVSEDAELPSVDAQLADAAARAAQAAQAAPPPMARPSSGLRRLTGEEAVKARLAGDTRPEAWGEPRGSFRPPRDAGEAWAASAVLRVAGMDPDRAAARNGVGFSKYDADFGASLAAALRDYGRLSDRQWAAALKLAARYRRQVGEAPASPSPG